MENSKENERGKDRKRPYCMMCCQRSNKRVKLEQCTHCETFYHGECYGQEGEIETSDSICIPCKSVGDVIKVREKDSEGKRLEFKITERPTECCLCGVDNTQVMLPMHPLYDHSGPTGRQLVLPATESKPRRLAWVHSVCGFYICNYPETLGCVFGTYRDGGFMEEGNEEAQSNDIDSVNSYLDEDRDVKDIHHFVMHTPELHSKIVDGEEQDDWLPAIAETQATKKCLFCNQDDRGSFRLAVDCCAKDEHGEYCCKGTFHVGCALYGGCPGNPSREQNHFPFFRRVFFDGYGGSFSKENAVAYCDVHAEDEDVRKPSRLIENLDFMTMKKDRVTAVSPPTNKEISKDPVEITADQNDSNTDTLQALILADIVRQLKDENDLDFQEHKATWRKASGYSETDFDRLWSRTLVEVYCEVYCNSEITYSGPDGNKMKGICTKLVRRTAEKVQANSEQNWKSWHKTLLEDALKEFGAEVVTKEAFKLVWKHVKKAMKFSYGVKVDKKDATMDEDHGNRSVDGNKESVGDRIQSENGECVSAVTKNATVQNLDRRVQATASVANKETAASQSNSDAGTKPVTNNTTPPDDGMGISEETGDENIPTINDEIVSSLSSPIDWSYLVASNSNYNPDRPCPDFSKPTMTVTKALDDYV